MSFRYTIETENPIVIDGNKMFNCNDGKLRLKIVEANPWHTGTPTEEGYYLCHIQFYSEDYESDEEGYDIPYWFKNGSWEGNDENVRIIAWQKIEPYEASKERE